jgi:hypothetical protein
MPTYTFYNKETDQEFTEMMSISERELFLKENPHITQIPVALTIVGGTSANKGLRTDDGWKENMQRIAEAHPTSAHAENYGDKSIKASKTREAVNKWRSNSKD